MSKLASLSLLMALCVAAAACSPNLVTPPASEAPTSGDEELALQALTAFFDHLNAGRYPEATELYGGSYEVLIGYNPDLDPQDLAGLFRNGCTVNGLQCLEVRDARLQEQVPATGEYRFLVEFSTADGELFVRGPCCGATEEEMPSESEFLFTVVRGGDGEYRVQDLPVYVP